MMKEHNEIKVRYMISDLQLSKKSNVLKFLHLYYRMGNRNSPGIIVTWSDSTSDCEY